MSLALASETRASVLVKFKSCLGAIRGSSGLASFVNPLLMLDFIDVGVNTGRPSPTDSNQVNRDLDVPTGRF